MDDGEHATRPTLRVISGDATPEEIAAVLAVVAARRRVVTERPEPATVSVWGAPGTEHPRARPRPGSGSHGWRTSYWPG